MSPASGGRYCGECDKIVHNVSSLSEPEAAAFVSSNRGSAICVRYLTDADGNVVFGVREDPTLVSPSMLTRRAKGLVAAAAIAGLSACEIIGAIEGEPDPQVIDCSVADAAIIARDADPDTDRFDGANAQPTADGGDAQVVEDGEVALDAGRTEPVVVGRAKASSDKP